MRHSSPRTTRQSRAPWMSDTRAIRYKTLRDIVLPGTHDSAAHSLNVGDPLDGSAQFDAHGPDWVGLEQKCQKTDEEGISDWLKLLRQLCINLTYDLAPFTQNLVARNITTAHSLNLLEQLEHGIRCFDLRITYRSPSVHSNWTGYRLITASSASRSRRCSPTSALTWSPSSTS